MASGRNLTTTFLAVDRFSKPMQRMQGKLHAINKQVNKVIPSFNGLGTTSLLILVGVILELSREIRSIILSNIYNDMFD